MKRVFLCFSVCILSASLLLHKQDLVAQSYVPVTNFHNGISISVQGTQGDDFVYDRYYFDPLINDCGLH